MTTSDDPGVPQRSGADVAEAVQTAADGTPHGGVVTPPHEARHASAPVEQVVGDKKMTEGQHLDGPLPTGQED